MLNDLLEALFSEGKPDWYEITELAIESGADVAWLQALYYLWLEQNDPDEFDSRISELVD